MERLDLEVANLASDKPKNTCGTCKHWLKLPRNSMQLGDPSPGECRQQIHSFPLLQQGRLVGQLVYYPNPNADIPACSHFQPAIAT